jgi:hypothetical protein
MNSAIYGNFIRGKKDELAAVTSTSGRSLFYKKGNFSSFACLGWNDDFV